MKIKKSIMNILILGSKGFLGKALKKYFTHKNFFVLGLDKKGSSNKNNFKANINKFDIKKKNSPKISFSLLHEKYFSNF